jgi:hypothetical protein
MKSDVQIECATRGKAKAPTFAALRAFLLQLSAFLYDYKLLGRNVHFLGGIE